MDDVLGQRMLQRPVDHVPRGLGLPHVKALYDSVVFIEVDPLDRIDARVARQRYVAERKRLQEQRLQDDAAASTVELPR
ncbi:hypothetical protein [Labilithrix luteola]|uniref:hypothetical protein n=1 Tax=Labilithrix luteola TaxID=1391654 RepID=UPI0014745A72|nr:hypothetical protein [Labilithrix luteola]